MPLSKMTLQHLPSKGACDLLWQQDCNRSCAVPAPRVSLRRLCTLPLSLSLCLCAVGKSGLYSWKLRDPLDQRPSQHLVDPAWTASVEGAIKVSWAWSTLEEALSWPAELWALINRGCVKPQSFGRINYAVKANWSKVRFTYRLYIRQYAINVSFQGMTLVLWLHRRLSLHVGDKYWHI